MWSQGLQDRFQRDWLALQVLENLWFYRIGLERSQDKRRLVFRKIGYLMDWLNIHQLLVTTGKDVVTFLRTFFWFF